MRKAVFVGVVCVAGSILLTVLVPPVRAAAGWGTPQLLDSTYVYSPQVAVDGNGDALAVWMKGTGSARSAAASRYAVGTGWSAPELIEANDTADVEDPEIAANAAGDAVAVWAMQPSSGPADVWANRYVPGAGWGNAQPIELDATGDPSGPQVGLDAAGNAIAVWQWYNGTRWSVWGNRYVAGTGWAAGQILAMDAGGPRIAVDPAGNAMMLYSWGNGTGYEVWAKRYVVGTGWGPSELLESGPGNISPAPDVAVDAAGDAVAVWVHHGAPQPTIWSSRYAADTGWGTPEFIGVSPQQLAWDPHVAIDPRGTAIAVWTVGMSPGDIWANRYAAAAGWGDAAPLAQHAGDASYAQVAMDAAGNAIAVWHQDDHAYADRYVSGRGWGTPERIEANATAAVIFPQVAMSPAGDAVVVWHQFLNTSSSVWANRYEAPRVAGNPFETGLAVAVAVFTVVVAVFLVFLLRRRRGKAAGSPPP